ncbi:MAG: hypothetical protein ACYS5W_02510 [Planctomycetota bacterium]|jgi:hypothetical protein
MTSSRLPRVFVPAIVLVSVAVLAAVDAQDPGSRRNPNQPRQPGQFRRGGSFAQASAEQRARPPLVPWQRNLEDALAMVARTGKPLLICVNMDNEPASERLAWVNYRDPEFVKLMDGFIPLLVSPDQRNARDWNDRGRRIPDRRFGRVVNYEHMTIEPTVAERYFGEERVAPRHVAVSKEGSLLFDIYLVRSFDPIVAALKKHGKPDSRGKQPDPSDMSEAALLKSPDAGHRDALEARFFKGDNATKVRIAGQALSQRRKTQHPEILRMALLADSTAVRRAAVENIARHIDRAPEELWVPAFRACGRDAVVLEKLESAMFRFAQSNKDGDNDKVQRAVNLGLVFAGLRSKSAILDVDRWRAALATAKPAAERPAEKPPQVEELEQLDKQLNELERQIRQKPTAALHLEAARTTLRYARVRMLQGRDPTFLLQDVCTQARAAAATTDAAIRGQAFGYLARASYLLDDQETTAFASREALPLLLDTGAAGSPLAAKVLDLFAKSTKNRTDELKNNKSPIWGALAGQTHAAYEVLTAHPACTEQQFLDYLDWLRVVGAYGFQAEVLERALARFPISGRLHQYRRYQQLRDWGAESLERIYAQMKPTPEHTAAIQWYSGFASLVAAERHVQNREGVAARTSYQRAVQKFSASAAANKTFADSAAHYTCLAQAGLARLLVDSKQWNAAVEAIQKGLVARPHSAGQQDGLGNTPAANANHVYNALLDAGKEDDAKGFQEAVLKHGVKVEKRTPRGRFGRRRRRN